MTLYDSLMMHA